MTRREQQLRRIDSRQQKWDGFMDLMQSARVVQNFTTLGFELRRTPPEVQEQLHAILLAGLPRAQLEAEAAAVGPMLKGRTDYVPLPDEQKFLAALQPIHEEWSGVKLTPVKAYGLRVYTNGSSLLMHHDKVSDHIVSSIVHVGHDSDEPWPLVIEGLDGETYEAALEAGEMLFYESAKCLHGRPRTFRGRWYSSLFVHYKPVDWHVSKEGTIVDAVPPDWDRPSAEPALLGLPELQLVRTGLFHPACAEGWCPLASSHRVTLHAPAAERLAPTLGSVQTCFAVGALTLLLLLCLSFLARRYKRSHRRRRWELFRQLSAPQKVV